MIKNCEIQLRQARDISPHLKFVEDLVIGKYKNQEENTYKKKANKYIIPIRVSPPLVER